METTKNSNGAQEVADRLERIKDQAWHVISPQVELGMVLGEPYLKAKGRDVITSIQIEAIERCGYELQAINFDKRIIWFREKWG